jgi:hypothetical protein
MSPIRLLPFSLFAITLPIAAQSAAAPKPVTSALTTTAAPANNPLHRVPGTNKPTLTAQLNTPCAMIRSYGFTQRDLESFNPRPSTFSTCTPATSGKILQIQEVGKAEPVRSK